MPKYSSRGRNSLSGHSAGVSSARLHQKSGARSAFGGYTKINNGSGTFIMKKTGFGE